MLLCSDFGNVSTAQQKHWLEHWQPQVGQERFRVTTDQVYPAGQQAKHRNWVFANTPSCLTSTSEPVRMQAEL